MTKKDYILVAEALRNEFQKSEELILDRRTILSEMTDVQEVR